MYKLKQMVKRGSAFAGAVGLLAGIGTSAVPVLVHADSLNPLTKRSLSLSSSSPGWAYTDGSGNSTYAPPNSGANGKQTGNTFQFNVSTDSTSAPGPIKAMSLQYCTTSAGLCTAPGNDSGSPRNDSVAGRQADLNVNFPTPVEVGDTTNGGNAGDFATVVNSTTGEIKAVPGVSDPNNPSNVTGQYAAKNLAGNFVIYYLSAGTWVQSTGWKLSTANVENGSGTLTGKNNYIILSNATGLGIPSDTTVKVVFFGTANNYITNPGDGYFFVKINTYSKEYKATSPGAGQVDLTGLEPASDANVIDGGVTVANVMNQSIQITTKVLETMQFSVGTVDPDTLSTSDGSSGVQSSYEKGENITAPSGASPHATYGPCDPILTQKVFDSNKPANVLQLGDQDAESSLSDTHTYSTHSYWRLSSNSSAGATVYYSGHTLSNTEGDQITPADNGSGNAVAPHVGSEQFGLAIAASTSSPYTTDYSQQGGTGTGAPFENAADQGLTSVLSDAVLGAGGSSPNSSYHTPQLFPLVPYTDSTSGRSINYGKGSGIIDSSVGSPTTQFGFDENSDTIPAAIATESNQVVDCVTAKMRYMANIAAITPAGIYTTKINYIAAPQY